PARVDDRLTFEDVSVEARYARISRLIGRFQWYVDVMVGVEEEGHVRQGVAHGHWLDVSNCHRRRVSGERKWFVRWGLVQVAREVRPQRPVNALRVARARWVQVDEQEMDPLLQGGRCLVEESPQRVLAALVAGRKDLDQGDDAMLA